MNKIIHLLAVIFIFSWLFLPQQIAQAVGESCTGFNDCDPNNMCVSTSFWGGKKCYPKIGGGCNTDADCSQIQEHLNIFGAFCNANKAVDGYPGSCDVEINSQYTCTWRQEMTTTNPEINSSNTTGGCHSTEQPGSNCDPAQKPSSSNTGFTNTRVVCCCPAQATIEPDKKADYIIPQMSIKIDTVKLSQEAFCTGTENSGECHIPWIAEYINGVYKYGFGIGGILAAIMLMAGGLMWLVSAGDASRISQAKDLILGSIIGLLILSTSYIILTAVNPELAKLRPIKIGEIDLIEIEGDSSSSISLDVPATAAFLGINCGQDSVQEIVNKSKGKVTYSQEKRTQRSTDNKIYFDCSSYASFVRECAGLPTITAYTGTIFQDRIKFEDNDTANLTPGDLIGWPHDNTPGHVFIYLGDGLFGDAHGGSGKEPGNAIGNNYSLGELKDVANRKGPGQLYIKR